MGKVLASLLPLLATLLTCHHRVACGYKFCGIDANDAGDACWQPCTADADCCSSSQECHDVPSSSSTCDSSHHDLSGSEHNYCGTSWCTASYECRTACPGGTDDECNVDNTGERCYADTPCGYSRSPPILPPPDRLSIFRYCGASLEDATEDCWQPCPGGDDGECCFGLTCHDTSSSASSSACPSSSDRYLGSDRYYCGSTWCHAAYECRTACPGGTDGECPTNERCYADVPCDGNAVPPNVTTDADTTTRFSMYCGTSHEDASELCWQPCRDDGDCCADQACHANVTSCGDARDDVGPDHYFCGSDFCDASYECRAPCPSGYDAECPAGYRCFPNAPCNANIRSYSVWTSSSEEETTGTTLDYGLPTRAMTLYRQYKLEGTADDASSSIDEGTTTKNEATYKTGVITGTLFGVCMVGLIVGNFILARRRRRGY